METLLLNDSFIHKLEDYINSQNYSISTKLLYISNLKKISKDYKEINKNNIIKLHKKLKHPYQRALLKIINDYCFLAQIPFQIKLPNIKKKSRKTPETLSLNEIRIIRDATPDKYKLLVRSIFGFGAGLRISEAIGISWHRFDWNEWLYKENVNIYLKPTKKREDELSDGIYMIQSTKRDKTYPVVVPKRLMIDYYNLAKELDILNEWGIPAIKEPVFDFGLSTFNPELRKNHPVLWKHHYTKHAYDYFRYNLIEKIFEPVLNRKIHIHMIRHSKASFLLEKGIPLEEISKLLGHEDIRTSMIYTRITIDKIRKSLKNIETI